MSAIVLVPGFSGSELFTPPSVFGIGPNINVWLNYAVLAAGGWKWLGLEADGRTPSTPYTGPLRPGLPLGDYYGQTCDFFVHRGWTVYGAKLDWRGLIAWDGALLADQVAALAAQAPLHLVCHSRGGLVARSAFQALAGRGQLGLVGRAVGLGVPHQGSWQAAALLSGFQSWAQLVRQLVGISTPSLFDSIGAANLQQVIVSWPGLYELIPAPFANGVTPQQLQILYDGSAWAAIKRNVAVPWLDAAHVAWSSLPNVPPAVQWLDVIGDGLYTPDQLLSSTPPLRDVDFSYFLAGDGTVPTRWGTQPDRPQLTFRGVSHAALPYNAAVLDAVDAFFRSGQLAGDVASPAKASA